MTTEKLYEIELLVTRIKTAEHDFNAYKAVEKTGKLTDLRFIRAVKNTPDEDCIIVVKASNINLDKKRKYPCYWVKGIEEIKPIERKQADLSEAFETV